MQLVSAWSVGSACCEVGWLPGRPSIVAKQLASPWSVDQANIATSRGDLPEGILVGDSSCQYGWHVLSTTVSETVKEVRPRFGWHVSPMYPPSRKERLTEGAQGLSVHCFCSGCSSCLHCAQLHLLQGRQTPPLLYVCSVRFTAPTLCSSHVQRHCGRPQNLVAACFEAATNSFMPAMPDYSSPTSMHRRLCMLRCSSLLPVPFHP